MIEVLTSFRFIAAFFVFLHHTVNMGKGYGEIGVTYFFILSGFILTYRYYDHFNHKLTKKGVLAFLVSRVSRIYPVHILTFLLAFILSFFVPSYFKVSPEQAIPNLFLLQWLFPYNVFTFNSASWSLSVEMIFYVLFPFLLFSICRLILKGKSVTDISFYKLFLLMAGNFALQSIVAFMVRDTKSKISWWLMYVSPFRATDFCMGMFLALIYLKCKKQNIFIKSFKLFSKQTLCFSFLEASALLLLIILKFKPIYNFNAAKFSINYIPGLCVLILVFSFQNGIFSRVLMQKLFVLLGEISFSFFMTHGLVIAFYHGVLHKTGAAYNLHILCISISLSAIIYGFYEMPMRDKVKTKLLAFTSSGYFNKKKGEQNSLNSSISD